MPLIDEANQNALRQSIGGITKIVQGVNSLRTLSGTDLANTVQTTYGVTPFDGLARFYIWNPTDTTPDNGTTVIKPYVGPTVGRWNAYGVATGGGGTGTVTSVALSMPPEFLVAGSPITMAGTFTVSLATQAAGTVFAGPATGAAAAPTFRTLLPTDIPGLPASQITSGVLSPTFGGTGVNGSAAADGTLLIGNGAGFTLASLTAGSGITITPGAGTITIAASGGGGSIGGSIASGQVAFGSGANTIQGSANLTYSDGNPLLVGGGSGAYQYNDRTGGGAQAWLLYANGGVNYFYSVAAGGNVWSLTSAGLMTVPSIQGDASPGTTLRLNQAGGDVVVGNTALTSNSGFLYISSTAGTPSGAPPTYGATVPIIYDTTTDVLYAYASGTWNSIGGGTIGGSIANDQVAYGSGTNTIQGSANLTFDGTNLTVDSVTRMSSAFGGAVLSNGYIAVGPTAVSNTGIQLQFSVSGSLPYIQAVNSGVGAVPLQLQIIGGDVDLAVGGGNVVVGDGFPTTLSGFLYIPAFNGTPSGAPTNYGNPVPIIYSLSDFELYAYAGGSWQVIGGNSSITPPLTLAGDSTGLLVLDGTSGSFDAGITWQKSGADTFGLYYTNPTGNGALILTDFTNNPSGDSRIFIETSSQPVSDAGYIGIELLNITTYFNCGFNASNAMAAVSIFGGALTNATPGQTLPYAASLSISGYPQEDSTLTVLAHASLTMSGSLVMGNTLGYLTTGATLGFLYLPTCNGTPTGTPEDWPYTTPIVYDTATSTLYSYNSGAWQAVGNGATIGGSIATDQIAYGGGINTIAGNANFTYSTVNGGVSITSPTSAGGAVLVTVNSENVFGPGANAVFLGFDYNSGQVNPVTIVFGSNGQNFASQQGFFNITSASVGSTAGAQTSFYFPQYSLTVPLVYFLAGRQTVGTAEIPFQASFGVNPNNVTFSVSDPDKNFASIFIVGGDTITATTATSGGRAVSMWIQNPPTITAPLTGQVASLWVENGSAVLGGIAITTTATDGFTYVPSCAGVPTGTPTTWNDAVALVVDSTDHVPWIYSGGSWVQMLSADALGTGQVPFVGVTAGYTYLQSTSNFTFTGSSGLQIGGFANPILSVYLTNSSVVVGGTAIATTATDGFLYIPSCAGVPTGTPTAQGNTVPLVVDTSSNTLYFYSGGAWVAA
jgi:hypothetical protein